MTATSSPWVARPGGTGIAIVNSELNVLVQSNGGLFHTIRFADRTWQRFGNVKGEAGDVFTRGMTMAGD